MWHHNDEKLRPSPMRLKSRQENRLPTFTQQKCQKSQADQVDSESNVKYAKKTRESGFVSSYCTGSCVQMIKIEKTA